MDPAWSIADLEARARHVLDPAVYDYCAGGAGHEETLEANVAAFRARRLRHRALAPVEAPDLATVLLGRPVALPVGVAPVGLQRLVNPAGEAGLAEAAAALGSLFCLSNWASCTVAEATAGAGPGVRWRQLYPLRDRGLLACLLDQAAGAGFAAVVLTLDVPVAARRHRDLRGGFDRFRASRPGLTREPGLAPAPGDSPADVERSLAWVDSLFPNPAADWSDLEWVAARSRLPVVAKGLVRPDDARTAVEAGAAAVVVSNHGGRQLDREVASLDALEAVVAEVGDRAEVLLDSGVRRGVDVLVALALGARAVLVGRAAVWGLAAGGAIGARRSLELLRDELAEAMVLTGTRSARAVDRSVLA